MVMILHAACDLMMMMMMMYDVACWQWLHLTVLEIWHLSIAWIMLIRDLFDVLLLCAFYLEWIRWMERLCSPLYRFTTHNVEAYDWRNGRRWQTDMNDSDSTLTVSTGLAASCPLSQSICVLSREVPKLWQLMAVGTSRSPRLLSHNSFHFHVPAQPHERELRVLATTKLQTVT